MANPQTSRPGALEWDKEGIRILTVRGSNELPSGITLSTPVVRIDKLTRGSEPEDWVDASADFTISGELIVDAIADDGTTNLGTDQAVQFQLAADPGTEPDETDDPVPGEEYRAVVTAARSDAGEWVGKAPLIIHF